MAVGLWDGRSGSTALTESVASRPLERTGFLDLEVLALRVVPGLAE